MKSRDFCYWLQGYFEILGADQSPIDKATVALSESQTQCIKHHLEMVFEHEIDPSMGTKTHQDDLTRIHQGGAPSSIDPKFLLTADVLIKC